MASHGHAGAVESRFASGHLLFGSDVRGTAKTWNSFFRESPRGIYLNAVLDIAIIIAISLISLATGKSCGVN